MQPAQYDHLKKLIESSVILTPTEKSEWLDMLIIMNDKQSSELEQILKAEAPTAPVQSVQPVPPVSGAVPHNLPMSDIVQHADGEVPNLSHISNLPSGLVSGGNIGVQNRPTPYSTPTATPPTPAPLAAMLKLPFESKSSQLKPQPQVVQQPQPKPRPSVPQPKLRPPVLQPRPSLAPVFAPPASTQPPASASPPTPTPPTFKSPAAEPNLMAKSGPVQLDSITDAGRLTVSAMRSFTSSDLLLRLQQLSKHEGYFSLLSYLEDSQLYKAYIATGKKMLTGMPSVDQGKPDPGLLTKSEFETFADILRKIQIN